MSEAISIQGSDRNRSLQELWAGNSSWILPLVAVVGMVFLWQALIWALKVPPYIAPAPLAVLDAFGGNAVTLWNNFLPTLLEAGLGFLLGNGIAILLAVWFVYSPTAEKAFYPLAVFIKTIPVLALAPILVLIFGNGYMPKILIAALICFFPTLVNMVRGLNAVPHATLELMRILSASNAEIFWKVRIQSSLPFLFAALKIASSSCVIGAMVGEWVGSNFGLGALIIQATMNYQSALLYAVVFTSSGLAVALFLIASAAEHRVISWKAPEVY